MSLIAIILFILAFLGFGYFSVEPEVAVSPSVEVIEVTEAPAPGWTLVELDGFEGVIVAPEAAAGLGLDEPYWAPTVSDVTDAEAAIAEAEGELDHTRQYAGFTQDGERKIFINGFCTDEPNWTQDIIFVLDGGECFFTAIYNVDTAELESFAFNGEA